MSEQNSDGKPDWKEEKMAERTGEYAQLEQTKVNAEFLLSHDKTLVELAKKRDVLNKEIAALEKEPLRNLAVVSQRQAAIRLELAESWGTCEGKTFECGVGTVTLRVTKSFNIRSKKKLVEFLMAINKPPDFVKTFEIAKLRNVKEAGLPDDDIARWDEHKNVAITLKEKPTVETKEVAEQ